MSRLTIVDSQCPWRRREPISSWVASVIEAGAPAHHDVQAAVGDAPDEAAQVVPDATSASCRWALARAARVDEQRLAAAGLRDDVPQDAGGRAVRG